MPILKASARYGANVVLAGLVAPGAGSLDRALASDMAGPGFTLANMGGSVQQVLTPDITYYGYCRSVGSEISYSEKTDWVSP